MNRMSQKDLRAVQRRARQLEKARAALGDAILQASRAGESLRDIAPWAGLSWSRVRDLLKEAEQREADRSS